ncbi:MULTISPECIES: hypothetical protein [unclassified Shewanella]|jgi:hypothetical protein|uniref:hypothetical protein n=1 Tax=Shewanella TaxID=22 RepID=UPI0021DA91EA|nr:MULTISPECIES: hypothetical protein [unclassified Shewanella]MCU7965522.1 hypothetical protein [Shewanella sp. SW32]MCU7973581.1 hypothetical protein [Shewanella sp. SW29]MCU8005266.1 hypothetical protein [Shewanella sp. SM96]MCU8032418.1 hypothetical protein [Shewanella sp. SM73]MCU8045592.1 hypothetical protein [Shewanella sp. SM68]
MLFKPTAHSRRLLPKYLTAAVHSIFEMRDDTALPLGAFFDKLGTETWLHQDGFWYAPVDIQQYERRDIDQAIVALFREGILSGTPFRTPANKLIEFELMDPNIEALLPRMRDVFAR